MNCVFDNIIFSLQNSGGISTYWYELISRMENNKNIESIYVENCRRAKSNILRKNIIIPDAKIIHRKSGLINRIFPISLVNKESFIFHSSYYRTTNNKNAKKITTVHDFVSEKIYRKKLSPSAIMRKIAILNSDHIIAISNNTKIDFLNFYPQIPEKKVSVIYNGVSSDYFVFNSKNYLEPDYVLFVGSRANYKNFDFVVELISKFTALKLYIVGSDLTEFEKSKISKTLQPDRWKLFVNIDNQELNKLYNNAAALIYPSFYEGFGIPILEAMKAGCPVIALNRSSIPEVAGDAAFLIDKLDLSDFYDAIIFLLGNKNYFLNKGLENTKRFSWDQTYNETFKLYNKL
jgi:mannosyltransferase